MATEKTVLANPDELREFVGLVGNFILHLNYHSELGKIKDPYADSEKFTRDFIFENAIDISHVIDSQKIEFLKSFNVEELDPEFLKDEKFKILLKQSFVNLGSMLQNLVKEENRFKLKDVVEEEKYETAFQDLEYIRNNPTGSKNSTSLAALSLY